MTTETYISPYLRQPLRSLTQVQGARVAKMIQDITAEQWKAMDKPARDAWKRINEGYAAHPVMGQRHICGGCGWDWYDHNHPPKACPDCGKPTTPTQEQC